MDYATDTHSLVWYLTEDPLLSKKDLKAFESTIREGIIIVPAVVLAEVMFISKKAKLLLLLKKLLKK